MEENKVYPTQANPEGFFFASSDEESQHIVTKVYPNGSTIKQVTLPKCKKIAVVRSLTAKETIEISRMMDKDTERYMIATITVATTFDGSKLPIEDLERLPMKDYQILLAMCGELNF